MKKNPVEIQMNKYYKSIKFKKIFPIFIYHECDKCHNIFVRETMYRCTYDDICLENMVHSYTGCTECFPTMESFKKHCEHYKIIPKSKWYHDGTLCNPYIQIIHELSHPYKFEPGITEEQYKEFM